MLTQHTLPRSEISPLVVSHSSLSFLNIQRLAKLEQPTRQQNGSKQCQQRNRSPWPTYLWFCLLLLEVRTLPLPASASPVLGLMHAPAYPMLYSFFVCLFKLGSPYETQTARKSLYNSSQPLLRSHLSSSHCVYHHSTPLYLTLCAPPQYTTVPPTVCTATIYHCTSYHVHPHSISL